MKLKEITQFKLVKFLTALISGTFVSYLLSFSPPYCEETLINGKVAVVMYAGKIVIPRFLITFLMVFLIVWVIYSVVITLKK